MGKDIPVKRKNTYIKHKIIGKCKLSGISYDFN